MGWNGFLFKLWLLTSNLSTDGKGFARLSHSLNFFQETAVRKDNNCTDNHNMSRDVTSNNVAFYSLETETPNAVQSVA